MVNGGRRRMNGNVLSAFLGIVMLIVIGAICAFGGYFVGTTQRSDQSLTLPGVPVPQRTTTYVPSVEDDMLSLSIPYSNEELRSQATRLKFAPLKRGDLAFDLVVPGNWTWQTVHVGERDLAQSNIREVQLAEIESPGSSLAIMQVWFLQIPEGASLSQFADSYTRARGFKTVEKAAEVGNRMDMLIEYDTSKQKDIKSRITAIKLGKNVMWLACCAPSPEYPRWNRAFTLAANSFSPAAAPIAFQPDVKTKLAQGAILVSEGSSAERTRTEAKTKSGIPPSNQADSDKQDRGAATPQSDSPTQPPPTPKTQSVMPGGTTGSPSPSAPMR